MPGLFVHCVWHVHILAVKHQGLTQFLNTPNEIYFGSVFTKGIRCFYFGAKISPWQSSDPKL